MKKNDSLIYWLILLPYLLLGVIVPTITQWCFRSDVLEQIVIGREWVIGSFKHPTMTTWIIEIFWQLLGPLPFVPYLASMICIGGAMYALWKLAQDYLPEKQALFASLVLTAYWYFNAGAAMYNNNVTMIFFWSFSLLFFHRALQTKCLRYWSLLGLCLGAALLCKYTSIFLVATIFLYLVLPKRTRIYWRTSGPYLTFFIAFVLFLPHLIFLYQHFDKIYGYIEAKNETIRYDLFLIELARGWLLQLAIIAPVVLSLLPLLKFPLIRKSVQKGEDREQSGGMKGECTSNHYLAWCFLTPFVLLLIAQLLLQIPFTNRGYGFHLWPLLGLFVLSTFELDLSPKRWQQAISLTAIFAWIQMMSLVVLFVYNYYFSQKPSVRLYPGRSVSTQIDTLWAEHFPAKNCPMVTSNNDPLAWCYGVYSRYNPRVLSPGAGTWLDDKDMLEQGGIIIWDAHESAEIPEPLKKRFPNANKLDVIEATYHQKNSNIPTVKVGVATISSSPTGGNVH